MGLNELKRNEKWREQVTKACCYGNQLLNVD